jgi:hypothetical protein
MGWTYVYNGTILANPGPSPHGTMGWDGQQGPTCVQWHNPGTIPGYPYMVQWDGMDSRD